MKKSHVKPAVIGLVMLLFGLLIGVAADRCTVHGAGSAPESQTAASRSLASGTVSIPGPDTLFSGTEDAWDPFRDMRDLQAEINEMFQRSVSRCQWSPLMDPFKNDIGHSLSLDVRDLKNHYEVRAYLPDAQATDAKVNLEGNQLRVEVTNRPTGGRSSTNSVVQSAEWGHYTQVVELAGKLDDGRMKVEHQNHELLITIPKA